MPDFVSIRTSQNVEITFQLAGLGSRIGARIIDSVIQIGYILIAAFLAGSTSSYLIFMILAIPVMLYSFVFEKFNNGQTPGKNAANIQVVSNNGEPVTTGMYLLRWLMLIPDLRIVGGVVGLIAVAASDKNQRLGDMAAGTLVISLNREVNQPQLAHEEILEHYRPIFIQASSLSDHDIRIIKQVLQDKSSRRYELLTKTAERVENLLDISKSSSSSTFLQTIVKDYNYYQNQTYFNSSSNLYPEDNDSPAF